MEFAGLFEGKVWPEIEGRLGVMSVDTLNRIWLPVLEEDGYLIAIAKNGEDALLGRMGKRDDGKFCIEIVVRAPIENNVTCLVSSGHFNLGERRRLLALNNTAA